MDCRMNQGEDPETNTISLRHIKISVLLALGLAHILVTLFFIVPGYLSIDEVVYHLTTKSFSQTGDFEIRNGYKELPSPEMYHEFFPPNKGRLVAQYPYLFSVLAAPVYLLSGFYGLFLINAVAFVGVVLLCYGTAVRLLRDRNLALNACLILVLCTFAWEYSQAAWPHMTSVLFISAAIYCVARSHVAETRREALGWALGAGLVAGLGPSIRMEAALLAPALLLPFLFARPWRPVEAVVVIAGTLPGLAAFGLVNYQKFGAPSPFSYGGPIIISRWLIIAILGLIVIAWIISRMRWREVVGRHRSKLFWAGAAALAVLLIMPQTRSFLLYVWKNFWASVVDVRSLDTSLILPAMTRSSGGGVVYIGAQKKALIQSLPFLAVLVSPIARVLRDQEDYPALLILLLLPVTTIGYYAYAFYYSGGYAGGLCLNYRYALPILPVLAILSAYGMECIKDRWGRPLIFRTGAFLCFFTAVVYFLFVRVLSSNLNDLEFPLLDLPLFIAGALLVVLLLGEMVRGDEIRALRPVVWAILIIGLTWSSLVAFFYDFPQQREHRSRNFYIGEAVRQVVAPGSVLFTFPVIDPFMRVIENRHVRVAFPGRDRFKDFPRLVRSHLDAGGRVYGAFYNNTWNKLKAGPLARYSLTPRLEPMPGFMIAEITLPHATDSSGHQRAQ